MPIFQDDIKPTIVIRKWDGDGHVVNVNGEPVGYTLSLQDACIVGEWLKQSAGELMRALRKDGCE